MATLIHFNNSPSKVMFRFDRALPYQGNQIEITFGNGSGLVNLSIDAVADSSGDLIATWDNISPTLLWNTYSHKTLIAVRPTANVGDWFPVYFRYPVKSIDAMLAAVPASVRRFSDGKPVIDSEGLAQGPSDSQSPYEKAKTHNFNQRFNPTTNGAPYIVDNVHGNYGDHGVTTAVGRGITWVANEAISPFKILYTCFEERRPSGTMAGDGLADEASPTTGGVVSVPKFDRL